MESRDLDLASMDTSDLKLHFYHLLLTYCAKNGFVGLDLGLVGLCFVLDFRLVHLDWRLYFELIGLDLGPDFGLVSPELGLNFGLFGLSWSSTWDLLVLTLVLT